MKRIATFFLTLVCIAAGIVHTIDLATNTNLTTGFVEYGNIWVRYAVLATLLLFILLASFLAPKYSASFGGASGTQGFVSILCGLCFAVAAGAGFPTLQAGFTLQALCSVLYLFTAVWFFALGASRFAAQLEAPSANALFGVVGTLSLFFLCIERTATNPSNPTRISLILYGLSSVAALVFCSVQLKIAYVPGGRDGEAIYLWGMASFFLCTCLSLPDAAYRFAQGSMDFANFMPHLSLAMIGISGIVWTFGSLGAPVEELQQDSSEFDIFDV